MPVQDALPAAIRLVLGPSADVHWRDRAEGGTWRSYPSVALSIVSTARLGVDERRYAVTGDESEDLRETVSGNRRLTIQIQVESTDQDIADSAHEVSDTIAAGLARTDVLDLLDAAGLGAGSVQPAREIPYLDAHGRHRSVVVFEVFFPMSRTHTGALIPRVKVVEVSGAVDGSEIGPTAIET